MRIRTLAFFTVAFLAHTVVLFAAPTVFVEYRNGETGTVAKASFKETAYFRSGSRKIEINPKKISKIDIFADTIDIYYGETWVRANVYPVSKDSIPPVYSGFINVSTILTGNADFGKLSASIAEIKHIDFKPKKTTATDTTTIQTDTTEIQDGQ